jgi:hypothetical protein
MYDTRGNFKLIDFGFSRLSIAANVLETSDFNTHSSSSRDLTQIMKYALVANLLLPTPGAGVYRDWIDTKINTVLASHCEGLIVPLHAAHDEDLKIKPWVDTYIHFNEHNNTNGTFDAVAQGMPALPVSPFVVAAAILQRAKELIYEYKGYIAFVAIVTGAYFVLPHQGGSKKLKRSTRKNTNRKNKKRYVGKKTRNSRR